jgi:hypothetical protein
MLSLTIPKLWIVGAAIGGPPSVVAEPIAAQAERTSYHDALYADVILIWGELALRIVKCSYATCANLLIGGWHDDEGDFTG